MDQIKELLIKLAKHSPWIIVAIIVVSQIIMVITQGYAQTATKWDDWIYYISSQIADVAKAVYTGIGG